MPTATIDVKEAVRIAAEYLAQLFPSLKNVALEEVELSEDDKHWLVTLGFDDPHGMNMPGLGIRNREYKSIKIDAQTGKPLSLKIRKP